MESAEPPNVLLVVLDCLRAKSLSRWGGSRTARTPVLDRLADQSVVFDRAIAPSNWTYPSHYAMLNGRPTGAFPSPGVPPIHGSLAHWLRQEHRYETALFTENDLLVAGLGLEEGFSSVRTSAGITTADLWESNANSLVQSVRRIVYGDRVVSLLRQLPAAGLAISAVEGLWYQTRKYAVADGRIVHDFDQWLTHRSRSSPFFALINVVDAHEPFRNASEWSRAGIRRLGYRLVSRNHALMVPQLRDRIPWSDLERGYLSEIARADAKVGEILRAVDQSGEADRTFVIVTADHGQSFGEGGFVYHGNGSAESVTRVPLLVRAPGLRPTRTARWVSLSEIPGWIASWVEEPGPEGPAAAELAPSPDGPERVVYCDGRPAHDTARVLRGRYPGELWNRRLVAAYCGDTKYVADTESHVVYRWDLRNGDPDAVDPEALDGLEATTAWHELIEPFLSQRLPAPFAPELHPDEDTRVLSALRSWGYE